MLFESAVFPDSAGRFPQIRYMGSKARLLPWIWSILKDLNFESALDPFCGSGCVSYLIKAMGKSVTASDFLHFCSVLAKATVENDRIQLSEDDIDFVFSFDRRQKHFIENTFSDIFFSQEDLRFLDRALWNISRFGCEHKRALAKAALIRSAVKRQPRGVFTVAGDPEKYKDGRRDLRLSLAEHFREQVCAYNNAVFDNGRMNRSVNCDVFSAPTDVDLVYLDPPYVPRSDDNCYVKRYHFLEGLSCYWMGQEILQESKVRKIKKKYTPFSYRKRAVEAFENVFRRFCNSQIVLSYSSNGYPDLDRLIDLLSRHKKRVVVHKKPHTYHFGTHSQARRNRVVEYLIVGR
jgi:DNA adenine methylase/adenine-specific DNA-methyltransferase